MDFNSASDSELRTFILQRADSQTGEGDQIFPHGILVAIGAEITEDNARRVNREMEYLHGRGLVKAIVSGAGLHAMLGITPRGRDELARAAKPQRDGDHGAGAPTFRMLSFRRKDDATLQCVGPMSVPEMNQSLDKVVADGWEIVQMYPAPGAVGLMPAGTTIEILFSKRG